VVQDGAIGLPIEEWHVDPEPVHTQGKSALPVPAVPKTESGPGAGDVEDIPGPGPGVLQIAAPDGGLHLIVRETVDEMKRISRVVAGQQGVALLIDFGDVDDPRRNPEAPPAVLSFHAKAG